MRLRKRVPKLLYRCCSRAGPAALCAEHMDQLRPLHRCAPRSGFLGGRNILSFDLHTLFKLTLGLCTDVTNSVNRRLPVHTVHEQHFGSAGGQQEANSTVFRRKHAICHFSDSSGEGLKPGGPVHSNPLNPG